MPRAAIALAIAFALVIVVFHVIRPDVDPLARGVSRYAVGPYGAIFNIVSLVLALSFVVTGFGVRQAAADTGTLGVYLLWLSAAGMVLVAFFPLRAMDPMAAYVYGHVQYRDVHWNPAVMKRVSDARERIQQRASEHLKR